MTGTQRFPSVRAVGEGASVHYTHWDSPLGKLLIAASPHGIVRIAFDCEPTTLVLTQLQDHPGTVEETSAVAHIQQAVEQLEEYFSGHRTNFQLALDHLPRAEFGLKVLTTLYNVPFGQQVSYAQLAQESGHTNASRAAGTVCSTNTIPLIIPCHRVVRSDGQTGNYRGGAHYKKQLLQWEKQCSITPMAFTPEQQPPAQPRETTGVSEDEQGRARPDWALETPLLRDYYDTEWGQPVLSESGILERICLEGFQSGLSWRTVLEKREAFREVFHNFHPDTMAQMGPQDVKKLLEDERIIRHKQKILSALANAKATVKLREHTGLAALVWSYQPPVTPMPRSAAEIPTVSEHSTALAAELKSHGFSFVGPTTMFALMEAIGMIDTRVIGSYGRGITGQWDEQGQLIRSCAEKIMSR